MSLSLLEHNYEEVFSMALDTDDATLGWLLSKVEGLQRFFPVDKKNIQSLLVRLAPLVTAEAGEYSYVFSLWFEVMLKKAVVSGLEITKEVREAKEHIEKKHQREFASIGLAVHLNVESHLGAMELFMRQHCLGTRRLKAVSWSGKSVSSNVTRRRNLRVAAEVKFVNAEEAKQLIAENSTVTQTSSSITIDH
ncbi:hypothetical protein Bca52824_029230 [Brassica carinata]|uniref:Uncharacterized protein n=1 Tax=Brassica carinata TaxID=52824 RepID=A0A8X7VDM8_BRACI|nr:hypothetical protein Bca52824_029230 [Brassica carinata]